MTTLRALFDVRPGEGRVVTFAFLGLLGVTAAHTLIETARDALFLARIPATHLPALYLTIAAAGIVSSRASVALDAKKRRRRPSVRGDAEESNSKKLDPVAISMLGAAAITAGFWMAAASSSSLVLYALYVFSGMFAGWVAGQLWLRFGALFTVVQAKRLYGAIGTGAVLGAVLGSLVARIALSVIAVRHLLLGASIVLVLTALGPIGLMPAAAPRSRARADDLEDLDGTSLGSEIRTVTGHPYLVRLLLLTLLAACAGTAIDFLFKRQIAESLTPDQLGPFIATVSLATNSASLLAQAIGVGVAVRWLGVQRVLYVMPVLIGLGAGATLLGGVMYGVLALRGIDGALRYSLQKTSTELLFVPLPDTLRSRAKPIIDLLGQRGGQAVASVAILALATLLPKSVAGLAVGGAILGIAGLWIVLAWTLLPRYLDVFRDTLRRGRVELTADLPDLDMGALEALIAALSSRRDAVVLGALDLLAAQRRGRLIPSLVLFHPSPPVVLRALDLLVLEGRTDFVDVADRLLDHANSEVRAAALRARAVVDPDAAVLRGCLDAPHEEVRATALVALVVTGELAADDAQAAFASVLESDVFARRALARAIGEVAASTARRGGGALIEAITRALARDVDADTRKLAATAMGALGSASFGPTLIEMLADRVAGLAAVDALAAMGQTTVGLLEQTLYRDAVAAEVQWRAAGALARSIAPEALPILVRRVTSTDDTALRSRILRALRAKRSAGLTIPVTQAELLTLADRTINAIARALSLRLAQTRLLEGRGKLATATGAELLQRLLRDKEVEGTDRLFLVLSLLYPEERFPRIQRGLESPDANERASARELLENVVRPPLRDAVIAVVDDIDDAARLAQIGEERTEDRYEDLIRAMVAQGGELGAIAAFHAGEAGFRDSMREAIAAMDPSGAAFARDLSVDAIEGEPA